MTDKEREVRSAAYTALSGLDQAQQELDTLEALLGYNAALDELYHAILEGVTALGNLTGYSEDTDS